MAEEEKKPSALFTKGDRIRIKYSNEVYKIFSSSQIKRFHAGGWIGDDLIKSYQGKTDTIYQREYDAERGHWGYRLDHISYLWDERLLELVEKK